MTLIELKEHLEKMLLNGIDPNTPVWSAISPVTSILKNLPTSSLSKKLALCSYVRNVG